MNHRRVGLVCPYCGREFYGYLKPGVSFPSNEFSEQNAKEKITFQSEQMVTCWEEGCHRRFLVDLTVFETEIIRITGFKDSKIPRSAILESVKHGLCAPIPGSANKEGGESEV